MIIGLGKRCPAKSPESKKLTTVCPLDEGVMDARCSCSCHLPTGQSNDDDSHLPSFARKKRRQEAKQNTDSSVSREGRSANPVAE